MKWFGGHQDEERPHTIQELAEQANVDFDPRISINSWSRSAVNLMKQAKVYVQEDQYETAFILLVRAAKIAIEDLPKHPQYSSLDPAKRKKLQNTGAETLALLSTVKVRISDRYEAWLAQQPDRGRRSPKTSFDSLTGEKSKPVKLKRKSKEKDEADQSWVVLEARKPAERAPSPSLPYAPAPSEPSFHIPQSLSRSSLRDTMTGATTGGSGRESPRSTTRELMPTPRPPSPRASPRQSLREYMPNDDYEPGPSRRDLEDRRQAEALARDFQYIDFPLPAVRDAPQPTAPRIFPPHITAPSDRASTLPDLSRHMSVHQLQQGYADSASTSSMGSDPQLRPRLPVEYPSLGGQPQPSSSSLAYQQPQGGRQEYPHLWRSTSIVSMPHGSRPPRPPKVRPGQPALLIPASKLGKAVTEAGDPLRDVLCPSNLMDRFISLAGKNTERNIETCGLLLGTLSDNVFQVTVLLLPKQKGTSDTCETTDEEAIFTFQDGRDLQTLAWIHTHPRQSCFLSSLDLHTHFSYQVTLAEAVAIVCAPHKSPSIGVFRLTDPPGLPIIGSCTQPNAFHPHPNAPIYTDANEGAGHFHLVPNMSLEVVDMR